jgi:hypothetical protein
MIAQPAGPERRSDARGPGGPVVAAMGVVVLGAALEPLVGELGPGPAVAGVVALARPGATRRPDRGVNDGVEGSRRQLVGAIVHLPHALNLPVVAEGVETPAQRDALLLVGCRLGQGYLFSVPISADEALAWLVVATVAPAAAAEHPEVPLSGDRAARA